MIPHCVCVFARPIVRLDCQQTRLDGRYGRRRRPGTDTARPPWQRARGAAIANLEALGSNPQVVVLADATVAMHPDGARQARAVAILPGHVTPSRFWQTPYRDRCAVGFARSRLSLDRDPTACQRHALLRVPQLRAPDVRSSRLPAGIALAVTPARCDGDGRGAVKSGIHQRLHSRSGGFACESDAGRRLDVRCEFQPARL